VIDERLARGRQHVVIYLLSTDALGHMLSPPRIEENLIRLDDWLEQLVYDYRGDLEIVMLADHGNHTTPPRRLDLRALLHDAGFRVADRLEKPGDVAVPEFGLLDVARVHTFDAETRTRVVNALRVRSEVELLASPDADDVLVFTTTESARVRSRLSSHARTYAYDPLQGDPLHLAETCAALRAGGQMDAEGFASESAWLAATHAHDFPNAVPRLWHGLHTISHERPDVVLSLAPAWFVGSGFFSNMAQMHGTHGGLHRRATDTFATTTAVDVPSPLGLRDVYELIRGTFHWDPAAHRPAAP